MIKVGDRVILTRDYVDLKVGHLGTVLEANEIRLGYSFPYRVAWDDNESSKANPYYMTESEIAPAPAQRPNVTVTAAKVNARDDFPFIAETQFGMVWVTPTSFTMLYGAGGTSKFEDDPFFSLEELRAKQFRGTVTIEAR